jgi:hypothetical protein
MGTRKEKKRKDPSPNKRPYPSALRKEKKERTQVQTKDHTLKCRTHDGELLSFCQNIIFLFEGLGHSKK